MTGIPMRGICTKCGETVSYEEYPDDKHEDHRSQCCGAPLKSIHRKISKQIERPYLRSQVFQEYALNHIIRFSFMGNRNVYLAEDGKSIHLMDVWTQLVQRTPVTLIPTDEIKDVPSGRYDFKGHVGPYRLFICAGAGHRPLYLEEEYDPTGVCRHCLANVDWCLSERRYWINEATYQRLMEANTT